MDIKQAVGEALQYITDIYAHTDIRHVDVEEVTFDETADAWRITVGFFRYWDQPARTPQLLSPAESRHWEPREWKKRTFKVVRLNDHDGRVVSMTHRELNASD